MSPASQTIAFGPFCLDLASESLQRDGTELPLRPQAVRALKALISHSGLHLDHSQMIRQAWDGVVVSKHTVTVTVGEVKRALGEYGSWIRCHPRLGYCLEVPESENLLRTGWHHLHRQTREGLEKALVCFEQAIGTGAESRALEGASRSLLLLGAFALRPPQDVYPRFKNYHARAVELRGYTPELRTDRALADHVFERRFADAETQFLAAIAEQPKLATAYSYLSMLYISWRRFEEAEQMVRAANAADALSPCLALAEILVRFCRRDFKAAVDHGQRILDIHPYFTPAAAFQACALERLGCIDEALTLYRRVCVLAPDVPWNLAMEGVCLLKAGQRQEAENALAELLRIRETLYVPGYHLSLLYWALGEREKALVELETAYQQGCPVMAFLDVDPKFDDFRGNPRFEALRQRIASANAVQTCSHA